MAHTLLIAAIIMAVAAVVVLIILPTRVRPYSEQKKHSARRPLRTMIPSILYPARIPVKGS